MTTFIDFRYSASQAAALRQDYIEIEEELRLSARKDCHLVVEISSPVQPGFLLRIGDMELSIDSESMLSLRYGENYLRSSASEKVQTGDLVAVRFGPTHIGMRWHDVVSEHEVHESPFSGKSNEVVLAPGARIMGRDTDRALKWGRLFYRKSPQGLCVEVVMDWQNPQAGIPSSAIAIVEELIEQSDYKIKLISYACDEEFARKSDFSRLFGAPDAPRITLHIAPPIYSRANPSTINIGLFVVESTEVAASTISRCNEMDAVLVPTHFVADALGKSAG